MNSNLNTQEQFSVYERRGQLVIALNTEIMMPENAPVRLVSAVLEELNYERLYRAYSPKGRKSAKDSCLQKTFWEKRAQATERMTTDRGIHLRLCRSIQVEGAFGLLKNDFGFRRFLTRGKANIRSELFRLAMAFDLKKLWIGVS